MLLKGNLRDIKLLQQQCEENESFQLKLNWDMLQNRDNEEQNDFFHYEEGKLVGFVGLYGFGNKVELCGMVSPEWRRKGIFTGLFNQAVEELRARKDKKLLVNAPANSLSAKGFLQQSDCVYNMSEYQMKWSETPLQKHDSVLVRRSEPRDLSDEVALEVQCFSFTEEEAAEFTDSIKKVGNEQLYMIEHNGNTVGKIRVDRNNGEAWIYGFAIYPQQQGKGIGRRALTNIILQERELGNDVFLEVEAKNAYALKLYQSCGFRAFHVQDYYDWPLL